MLVICKPARFTWESQDYSFHSIISFFRLLSQKPSLFYSFMSLTALDCIQNYLCINLVLISQIAQRMSVYIIKSTDCLLSIFKSKKIIYQVWYKSCIVTFFENTKQIRLSTVPRHLPTGFLNKLLCVTDQHISLSLYDFCIKLSLLVVHPLSNGLGWVPAVDVDFVTSHVEQIGFEQSLHVSVDSLATAVYCYVLY